MTEAELEGYERWLESKIRGLEIDLTDKVRLHDIYVAGCGHKGGFKEALDELRKRRSGVEDEAQDQDPKGSGDGGEEVRLR